MIYIYVKNNNRKINNEEDKVIFYSYSAFSWILKYPELKN